MKGDTMTNKSEYTVLRLQECDAVDPETPLVIVHGVDAELARETYHTDPAYVAIGGLVCLRKERLTLDEAEVIRQGIEIERAYQSARAKSMRDGKPDGMTDDELQELCALVQAAKHDEYALWRVMNIMAENAEWLLDMVMRDR